MDPQDPKKVNNLSMMTKLTLGTRLFSHDVRVQPMQEEVVAGPHSIKVNKDIIKDDLPL